MIEWTTIKIKLDLDKNELYRFKFKDVTTDSSGKSLDETEYNDDCSVSCKRIYRYFEDGTVKQYVEHDPAEQLIERHVYVENENGDIEKIIYEYAGDHKIVKHFTLSDLGLADTATLYDESNVIVGYETYVFNEDGDVTQRIDFDEARVETVRLESQYNDSRNVMEERKFVAGKLTEVTKFSYSPEGKIMRKELTNKKDGYKTVDEYHYGDRGNMVQLVTFQNGMLVFENKCTYDEHDNLFTEEFFEIDFWEKKVERHEKLVHVRSDCLPHGLGFSLSELKGSQT